MNIIEAIHNSRVLNRRFRILSNHISRLIPPKASVLDIGCGSGEIDRLILEQRRDITIEGTDVLVRDNTSISVIKYDGSKLPCEDNKYNTVIFIDVLHHTTNLEELLSEAARVTKKFIIIKDHTCEGVFSKVRLNFMDQVGNRRFAVKLAYNYYTEAQWLETFEKIGLHIDIWESKLNLYPWPFSLVFDSTLHFVARLEK